jgi:hypothetical protein
MSSSFKTIESIQHLGTALANIHVECVGFSGTLENLYRHGWRIQYAGTGMPHTVGFNEDMMEPRRIYPKTRVRIYNPKMGLVAGSIVVNSTFTNGDNYTIHAAFLHALKDCQFTFQHIGYVKRYDRDQRFHLRPTWETSTKAIEKVVPVAADIATIPLEATDLPVLYDRLIEVQEKSAAIARATIERHNKIINKSNSVHFES